MIQYPPTPFDKLSVGPTVVSHNQNHSPCQLEHMFKNLPSIKPGFKENPVSLPEGNHSCNYRYDCKFGDGTCHCSSQLVTDSNIFPILVEGCIPCRDTPRTYLKHSWLVVWNIFYCSIYWECHHPN